MPLPTGPTPWDPCPAPPEPAWKSQVKVTLGAVMLVDEVSADKLETLNELYSTQESAYNKVFEAKDWEHLAEVTDPLVKTASALKVENLIRSQVVFYRNAVSKWALNRSFYDAHPDLPAPAWPFMPKEMLDYLDKI